MEMIRYDRPFKPINIMPLADIQWCGHDGPTAIDTLRREIQRGLDNDCWFVGVGDYIDFMSPSNRDRVRGARLYDTSRTQLDTSANRLVDELYHEVLKPTTGRWLGLVEGHHLWEYAEGDTSDMRLCRLLGAPFLGTSAFIGLSFNRGETTRAICNLWVHHGAGSCQTVSGQLPRLERLANSFEADVFVMAHYTQKPQSEIERVYPVWRKSPYLRHKVVKLVGAGGFGRGYQVGARQGQVARGNYVEQRALRPVVLGAPIVRITPRRVFYEPNEQYAGLVGKRKLEAIEFDIRVEA